MLDIPKQDWAQVGIPCEIPAPGVGVGFCWVHRGENKHFGLNPQRGLTGCVNIKAATFYILFYIQYFILVSFPESQNC